MDIYNKKSKAELIKAIGNRESDIKGLIQSVERRDRELDTLTRSNCLLKLENESLNNKITIGIRNLDNKDWTIDELQAQLGALQFKQRSLNEEEIKKLWETFLVSISHSEDAEYYAENYTIDGNAISFLRDFLEFLNKK